MPRTYKRKTDRAKWTQKALTEAAEKVAEGKITIWTASKQFGIPYRTLKRRIHQNNLDKGMLGRPASLGCHEAELVEYIQKLENAGFPPTTSAVRRLAFTFAEKNKIPHMFNKDAQTAGYDWLKNFILRHPALSVRKAEGISIARGLGMCREEVTNYFELLLKICEQHNFLANPSKIYNVDESGIQLNNEPGKVVATKGAREVHHVTSAEKGETISVIACCNAEGKFLPPYCIFKGKRKRAEFEDGLPPGSHVEMGQTSAYVNTELFFSWLKNHFAPRKESGMVLLILDGHRSHCSDVSVLDFAAENNIILLCLPSHTTQYLQPLDRSFFKPLKTYWQRAASHWISSNPGRKLTRYQFGTLLCTAWNLAATIGNGTSGFKACGIFPYNPQQIPEHAFEISTVAQSANTPGQLHTANTVSNIEPASPLTSTGPTCADAVATTSTGHSTISFDDIAPVPRLRKPESTRRKQHAQELTSYENREQLRKKQHLKSVKSEKKNLKRKNSQPKRVIKNVKRTRPSSSSEEGEVLYAGSSSGMDDDLNDFCAVCDGCYYQKKGPKCDWVISSCCGKWVHEDCLGPNSKCQKCA